MAAGQYPLLFAPIQIGPITVRNRIVMPAHFTAYGDPHPSYGRGGWYGERYAYYLAERSQGGVGLIIMGQASAHPNTSYEVNNMSVAYDRRAIPGFRLATDMVHEHGARIFLQLYHSGFNNSGSVSKLAVWAPSALVAPPILSSSEIAKEMEKEEIDELKDYFALSASHAVEGGFDGVELHCAAGYLFQEFLSPLLNRRTDEYGGSLDNRMRLLVEVIARVRAVIGSGRALGVRISADELLPGGYTLEDMQEIVRRLEDGGQIDYVSVNVGTLHNAVFMVAPLYFPHGNLIPFAAGIKQAVTRLLVFAVGRIVTPEVAESILEQGVADLVCMARALIADPELPNKARAGKRDEIRPCVGDCQECIGRMYKGQPIGCITNPAMGFEKELGIGTLRPAERRKRVLVVGGGLAGMEAAWVAAARGHDVALYERSPELGGQIVLAARLPGREEMLGLADWRMTMIQKYGVRVVLGVEADRALVEREHPDAVVVATGSVPLRNGMQGLTYREIPGWDKSCVATAEDVVQEARRPGGKVVIYDVDGHIKGPGVAEFLADQGCEVLLVMPTPDVGPKLDAQTHTAVLERLGARGVQLVPRRLLTSIGNGRVDLRNLYAKLDESIENVNTVVLVTGNEADHRLYGLLKGRVLELYLIGDALAPRTADRAVHDGHRVGRAL